MRQAIAFLHTETDSRLEPPKFLRFKFKPRQVNYSSQIKPRTTWFLSFVFNVVAATALAVVAAQVIAAVAIAVTVAVILRDRDNLLGWRRWDTASTTGGTFVPTSSLALQLSGAGGGLEDGPLSSSKWRMLLGEAMEAVIIVKVVEVIF
jgi:hypothetical protein